VLVKVARGKLAFNAGRARDANALFSLTSVERCYSRLLANSVIRSREFRNSIVKTASSFLSSYYVVCA
jgi:hypothetical protein